MILLCLAGNTAVVRRRNESCEWKVKFLAGVPVLFVGFDKIAAIDVFCRFQMAARCWGQAARLG